jgi:hypothetical protein
MSETGDGIDNDCDGQIDEGCNQCLDIDGDGFPGTNPNGTWCGTDCNDLDATVHPGAPEICGDFLDNDCNGIVDDNCGGCADLDGDGFLGAAPTCPNGNDCNDTNATIYPGAQELCDGLDNDCDGQVDEGCGGQCGNGILEAGEQCDDGNLVNGDGCDSRCQLELPCADLDGDGVPGTRPDGSSCGNDCNDFDPTIFPGAPEACDGIDNDCDGQVDEGCNQCFDLDRDGYPGTDANGGTCGSDCDDWNPMVFPGAPEICGDGIDNNCNGVVDEGCGGCTDHDGDGYLGGTDPSCAVDCDDFDASVNPGAQEICDGIDNNCDGQVDESFDRDRDGFSVCAGDCDDQDAATYPGAPELCDMLDNDCDGALSRGEHDADGDSWAGCEGDCDDRNDDVNPDEDEICNQIDDDCDGHVDENNVCDDDNGGGSCRWRGGAITFSFLPMLLGSLRLRARIRED